jgi:hypothetical protein
MFKQHLSMVIEAIVYGDRSFIKANELFLTAPILIHFHARQDALNTLEPWGNVKDYLPGKTSYCPLLSAFR